MNFTPEMLRLYAVTDRSWLGNQSLAEQVEQALLGGATMVQLREKALEEASFLRQARELAALCHRYGVPLLINDNMDIALRSGADGVHLGQDDLPAADARKRLGQYGILGVTAKTVDQAILAQEAGADYLGSGAVFGSTTKQNALPMTRELLMQICGAVSIPVVAIGGINRDNLLDLAGTGIRGAAVVSGIFAAADIRQECLHLRSLLDQVVQN